MSKRPLVTASFFPAARRASRQGRTWSSERILSRKLISMPDSGQGRPRLARVDVVSRVSLVGGGAGGGGRRGRIEVRAPCAGGGGWSAKFIPLPGTGMRCRQPGALKVDGFLKSSGIRRRHAGPHGPRLDLSFVVPHLN